MDHSLTDRVAVCICYLTRLLTISMLFVPLSACGQSAGNASSIADISTTSSDAPRVIDAGVVFVDQRSYFCIPLRQLGINDMGAVVSANSSCECLHPSVVSFRDAANEVSEALRVEFAPEPGLIESSTTSAQLGVEVRLRLKDGAAKVVRFDFLHALGDKTP